MWDLCKNQFPLSKIHDTEHLLCRFPSIMGPDGNFYSCNPCTDVYDLNWYAGNTMVGRTFHFALDNL